MCENRYSVSFKLRKNPSKIKIVSQGPLTKAFFNSEDEQSISAKNRKNKLPILPEDLEKNETPLDINQDNDFKQKYTEPLWSGTPEDIYKVEVLKSGVLLKTLDISFKNYYVIGKSLFCDITFNHETISQFHAVFQYRKISDSENKKGMYIYDLNSSYGTFLNQCRIEPNKYILLQSGCVISFGDSERKYILQTPRDNEEKEAKLSSVELEELKILELQEQERLENEYLHKKREEELKKEQDTKGINWGIPEHDENSKLSESSGTIESEDEDLFINDPHKALREWFKWEGYDLEFQIQDRGLRRFDCRIDLPLDISGTIKIVEVTVVGDRAEAADKCALKACMILNKLGLLQQAREEKKSTVRNWEEVDYYESDEDNFLDRTVTIEKKRQQRMQIAGKSCFENETNHNLHEKRSKIIDRMTYLQNLLALQEINKDKQEDSDEDALDSFMSKLDVSILNKTEIRNIKVELHNLQQEEKLLIHTFHLNNESLSKPQVLHQNQDKTSN